MTTGTPEGGSSGGPTVLRILLGAQLRRLREGKGISREDAGYEIRASGSKISRMELGRVSFKERDVADLLSIYGVPTTPSARRCWVWPGRPTTPAGGTTSETSCRPGSSPTWGSRPRPR